MSSVASARWARWLPRSMASRVYLIIFAGLMLAQGLSFALMFYERQESATTVMLDTVEHEVGTSVAMLDRLPASERAAWLSLLQRDNYRFMLGRGSPGTPLASPRSHEVVRRIEREVGSGYGIAADTVSTHPERYQVHFTLHDAHIGSHTARHSAHRALAADRFGAGIAAVAALYMASGALGHAAVEASRASGRSHDAHGGGPANERTRPG